MTKYKEFKKELKQVYITNDRSFSTTLESFLTKNPGIKIVSTIVHKPYHVTIIYEASVHV